MFRKTFLTPLLFLISTVCFSQILPITSVSLRKQKNLARWDVPGANYSGITHLGDDRYAVVSDKEDGEGFYVFSISIDSVKGKVKDVRLLSKPTILEANNQQPNGSSIDAEDVAFVPSCHTAFIADEGRQKITEYDLDGKRTRRELLIPPYLSVDSIYPNYGFESLTYSEKDNLLWTITEHTLKNDGKKSDASNREGCLLRLQSFSAKTCRPISFHYYKTDAPTAKKRGRNYAFGVSAIASLEDGTILLMEREFYVARKYLGSWGKVKIYRVDLQKKTSEGYLHKELIASFKNRLNVVKRNIANYEGMCLGPRLTDGRQTIILLSDSQNNFGRRFFHLKDDIRILHISRGVK